jgi:hypothetical protein
LSKNAPNAVPGSATTTWASINGNAFYAKITHLATNTTTLTAISAESASELTLKSGNHRHHILRIARKYKAPLLGSGALLFEQENTKW